MDKLSKTDISLTNTFIANEKVLAKYYQDVLAQQRRNKEVLKERLMGNLKSDFTSDGALIPYGRTEQKLFRQDLEDAIEVIDDKEFTKFIKKQFKYPYTPLDKINLLIYTELVLASKSYASTLEIGWSEIINRTLGDMEDRDRIRNLILGLMWTDGRDILTFYDRVMLNGYRVAQSTVQEITREVVGGVRLSTVDAIINKRLRIQGNDLKRIVETSSTFYTNNSFFEKYTILYGMSLWRHISVLDDRTTELCWSRHGKVWETRELEQGVTIPPLHYRCRSVLVPVI